MTLRCTLSIVPWGNEEAIYEIGRLDINNQGQLSRSVCQYQVIDLGDTPGEFNKKVLHFREDGAWELLRKVLSDVTTTNISSVDK